MKSLLMLSALIVTPLISTSVFAADEAMKTGDLEKICLGSNAESKTACEIYIREGTHEIPSPYCTSTGTWDEKTGEWPPCEGISDVFSIYKTNADEYSFSVRSVQTNGHECNASGDAKLVNGEFVFVGDGSIDDPDLRIFVKKGAIRFIGNGMLCGARADWGSVAFPILPNE